MHVDYTRKAFSSKTHSSVVLFLMTHRKKNDAAPMVTTTIGIAMTKKRATESMVRRKNFRRSCVSSRTYEFDLRVMDPG